MERQRQYYGRVGFHRAPRMALCHPEEQHYARGLCHKCYLSAWRYKRLYGEWLCKGDEDMRRRALDLLRHKLNDIAFQTVALTDDPSRWHRVRHHFANELDELHGQLRWMVRLLAVMDPGPGRYPGAARGVPTVAGTETPQVISDAPST